MLLPHHRELVDRLRPPSTDAPWRVLVSGCLAGWRCGVDGDDYGLGAVLADLLALPTVRALPFCPEQEGLGTPRTMPISMAATAWTSSADARASSIRTGPT